LDPHFIQVGDEPAIIGEGSDDLPCPSCGSVLVKGYLPLNLLGIDIRCARCGTITTTPGLPAGSNVPPRVMPVERRLEPLPRSATVGRLAALASREEIERLARLYAPRTPSSDRFVVDQAFLDQAALDYDRLTDGKLDHDLAVAAAAGTQPAAGIRANALAWALEHLRAASRAEGWSWYGTDAGSVATTVVAAFQHFVACWSHHPLFGAMVATVADLGFSLHAFARFGAAKCLADSGNRIGFPPPEESDGRIADFFIPVSPTERWDVIVKVFDQFEWPEGRSWDQGSLRAAVLDAMETSQGRINRRHFGLLVLSAGAVRSAFDQPIVDAINDAMQAHGRRNRGLGGVSVIMPKLLATDLPNAARFGFAFYPVGNQHFAGQISPLGGQPATRGF
jgi:hypothetical protein